MISSLGYLLWQSPDADGWDAFAKDVLGFMPVDGPSGRDRCFRIDDYPYRLVVTPGPKRLLGVGLEVVDDLALGRLVGHLEALGVEATTGSESECDERRVSGLLRVVDPNGVPVEVFHGPVLDHVPVQTPLVSGFVTGRLGMGHVVMVAENFDVTKAFYREALGFRLRNTMRRPGPGGRVGRVEFFGCGPRHHTVGLAEGRRDGKMHHFMVELADLDDVGRALDRCLDGAAPLELTLGRHTNDHMVSFYVRTPDGDSVEVGWGGLHVGADAPTTYEITKTSFWGHRPADP